MSYEGDDWLLTDFERECGIGRLLSENSNGRSDELNLHDSAASAESNSVRLLSSEAIRAVSHLKTVEQIQNKLLKKMIDRNLDALIISYSKAEKLPDVHVNISRQPRALPIFLKGFLKEHMHPELDVNIIDSIEAFCEKIYRNDEYEIVYDRVSRIQRFVHNLIDEELGAGQRFHLPITPMRCLLSGARLHLNIIDFKYQNSNALLSILTRSKHASDEERASRGGAIAIPRGRRYIKNWRVLHLESIMQYQSYIIGNRLYALMLIDKEQDVETFREQAVNIYSGRFLPDNLPDWEQHYRWSNKKWQQLPR